MSSSVHSATFLKAITRLEQSPPFRPAVAFAGRSNVGKSSLINKIVRRKNLARTSNTPGRTQEIHFYDIDEKYYFIDLPGYGYAKVPLTIQRRWGPMMHRFLTGTDMLRLVVMILDVRRNPGPEDLQMIDWLDSREVPYIFAITKTDKVGRQELIRRLAYLQPQLDLPDASALVPVSSLTGAGVADLTRVIFDTLAK